MRLKNHRRLVSRLRTSAAVGYLTSYVDGGGSSGCRNVLIVCFGTGIHTHVERTIVVCEASGFGRGVVEACPLLGCFAAYVGTVYRRFGTVYWSNIQESRSHKRGDLQSISAKRLYLTFMLVLDVEPFRRPQIVPHREHILSQ